MQQLRGTDGYPRGCGEWTPVQSPGDVGRRKAATLNAEENDRGACIHSLTLWLSEEGILDNYVYDRD